MAKSGKIGPITPSPCGICGAPATVNGSAHFVTYEGEPGAVIVCEEHMRLWIAGQADREVK